MEENKQAESQKEQDPQVPDAEQLAVFQPSFGSLEYDLSNIAIINDNFQTNLASYPSSLAFPFEPLPAITG